MTWIFWALLSADICRGNRLTREGRRRRHRQQPRHSHPNYRRPRLHLDDRAQPRTPITGLALIGRRSWVFLVLSGLCTGLSWLCYFRALQIGPVSGVAPIDKLSVAIVIVAGWLFFGESMSPPKIVGAALVTAGALVLAFA